MHNTRPANPKLSRFLIVSLLEKHPWNMVKTLKFGPLETPKIIVWHAVRFKLCIPGLKRLALYIVSFCILDRHIRDVLPIRHSLPEVWRHRMSHRRVSLPFWILWGYIGKVSLFLSSLIWWNHIIDRNLRKKSFTNVLASRDKNCWILSDRDEVMMSDKIDGVVAHFIAHNKVTNYGNFSS